MAKRSESRQIWIHNSIYTALERLRAEEGRIEPMNTFIENLLNQIAERKIIVSSDRAVTASVRQIGGEFDYGKTLELLEATVAMMKKRAGKSKPPSSHDLLQKDPSEWTEQDVQLALEVGIRLQRKSELEAARSRPAKKRLA